MFGDLAILLLPGGGTRRGAHTPLHPCKQGVGGFDASFSRKTTLKVDHSDVLKAVLPPFGTSMCTGRFLVHAGPAQQKS